MKQHLTVVGYVRNVVVSYISLNNKRKDGGNMAYGPSMERGSWSDPIRFVDVNRFDMNQLKEDLTCWCEGKGIPATISISEYVTGSFFSKSKAPLLLISNPRPDCKYFTLGIYANGNVLSYPLFGESAENTKNNKYEYYKSQGTGLKATFYKPDTLKLQQEAMWQRDIFEFFEPAR